jgi:hypothetical protein
VLCEQGMDAKSSRTGCHELASFIDADENASYRVAELSDPTSEDHWQNSFGLSSDLHVFLASYLELWDIVSMSMTCKTWRRIASREELWRNVARRKKVTLEPGVSPRVAVLGAEALSVKPEFAWLPSCALERDSPSEKDGFLGVNVVFLSPPGELGCGKSAIIFQYVHNCFVDEISQRYANEIVFLAKSFIHGRNVGFQIVDTRGSGSPNDPMRTECLKQCNVVFVCSQFDRHNSAKDVQNLCDAVLQQRAEKDVDIVVIRTQADKKLPWQGFGSMLSYCKRHQFPLMSCSGKLRTNLTELFTVTATLTSNRSLGKAND